MLLKCCSPEPWTTDLSAAGPHRGRQALNKDVQAKIAGNLGHRRIATPFLTKFAGICGTDYDERLDLDEKQFASVSDEMKVF